MVTSCSNYLLLAVEFGQAIDSCRSTRLVFFARYVIWFLSENVVSGNLYKKSIYLLHSNGEILRSFRIEFLCQCLVCFGGIYIRICCTIDDCRNIVLYHTSSDSIKVCYVEE